MAGQQIQSSISYQIAGRSTLPNQFSEVPQQPVLGCLEAQDMVATRDGLLETRRGWEDFIATLGYGNVLTQIEFENNMVYWTDKNYLLYTPDGINVFAYIGNYYAPTPTNPASRIRFLLSNNNLYFNSSVGYWKIDFISNGPVLAGAPQALDGFATLTQVNGGFLPGDSAVSYRGQFSYFDANNNEVLGPPSNQIQIANSFIGTQTINVGGGATTGGSTGLSNDSTVYNASVLVNGSDNVALNITGSAAQTFANLLTLINTAITGVATATLSGGNILITSTLVQGSAISWADGAVNPLAASLTGFVAVETEVDATAEVNLEFMVPLPIVNSSIQWTFTIYRGNISASSTDPGDDNGQSVASFPVTGTMLSSRLINYTDNLPDSDRGVTIDTAPSQQGAGSADFMPPLCQDHCQYRGYTFFFDIQTLYTLNFTLIAVGAPDGIQVTDTITINYGTNSFTITGAVSENVALGQFAVVTAYDPATNITLTAQSIDRVINLLAANTFVWAQYISGQSLPGQLNLTDLVLPGVAFYINTNRGTAFSVAIPASGSTSVNTAINTTIPNQLMISKYDIPESVPIGVPGGIIRVGSSNFPILRGIANRTSLFIFKGGLEGCYYLQGNEGPTPGTVASGFTLLPLDATVHLINQNVCDLIDNLVAISTDQGPMTISETGKQLVGRPIQRDYQAQQSMPNFNALVNSVAYQADENWIINCPLQDTDTTATMSHIYNSITQEWTTWTRPFTSMYVRPSTGLLYAAAPVNGDSQVKVERKTETDADYCDEQYPITITAAGGFTGPGNQLIIVSSAANLAPGQIIQQGTNYADVVFVYPSNNRVIVSSSVLLTTGSATSLVPIDNYWLTHPMYNFAPAVVKKWSEATVLLLNTTVYDLNLSFTTDWTNLEAASPIDFGPQVAISDGFAIGPFGIGPFALEQVNYSDRLRTFIPRAWAQSNWIQGILQARCINGPLRIQGFGLVAENISSAQY